MIYFNKGEVGSGQKIKYTDLLLIMLAAVPIFIYITNVYKIALNVPYWEDYDTVLGFMLEYKKAVGYEKLEILFRHEGEPRTFLFKFLQVLHYAIYGNINFRHFALCNTFFIISIFSVCVHFIKRSMPNSWQLGMLLLSYTLFDLNNYENAIFASAGLLNYGLIFIFLMSLFFYTLKSSIFIPLGILFQIACIFSGGIGTIGAIIIAFCLILNKERSKMVASIITLGIFCPLYFYHYTLPFISTDVFARMHVSNSLPYFLVSIGNNISYTYALLAGLVTCVIIINVLISGWSIYKKEFVLLSIMTFTLAALFAKAAYRFDSPLFSATSPRYAIYAHITIVLFVVLLTKRMNKKWLVFASVFLFITNYYLHYPGGKSGFMLIYNAEKKSDYAYPPEAKDHARQLTEESCKEGIYCIEQHRND